jgi:hypothetical protein
LCTGARAACIGGFDVEGWRFLARRVVRVFGHFYLAAAGTPDMLDAMFAGILEGGDLAHDDVVVDGVELTGS